MEDLSIISGYKNILFVQLGDIGDVVLTTPTIRAVKENHPDASVSILVRKPYGSLLVADPNIHEVVEFEKTHSALPRLLREYTTFALRLRHARYDLVVDLRTGDRGAIFSFLTGAPVRVGRLDGERKFWQRILYTTLHNPPFAPLPVHPGADQSLRIVRALGMDTQDSAPKLHVAINDMARACELLSECELAPDHHYVTINPCSRWKYKEWGYEKWGELADMLWRVYQLPVILVGAPEDVAATTTIAHVRSSHVFNLAGKTTLGELAALLSLSALHLGVDSAAPHIAASVGTPTVTIFGPSNWKGWMAVNDFHRVVAASMPCVPCNRKGCDDTWKSRCMDELGVNDVWKTTDELLEKLSIERLP